MPIFDKPDWIHHGGVSILGADIDAAGERLATCGQDNKIRIWSMRPLRTEAAELDPDVPKQLATLSEFMAPVNCVRFAPNAASGDAGGSAATAGASRAALAAGSDDKDAYVFELREGRGHAAFGSGEALNLENWRLRLRLRGHESNVADVAWSPDGRRLATASFDNKVKIWDSSTGHCQRSLEGHEGLVKGVAWDPFDLYIASLGDREAIVWRLEDGTAVTRITAPFVGAPDVAFSLRPAWSPDGQTLALPHGFENGVHMAPLIHRNTWASGEYSLVGHRGPVIVVRYNPYMYVCKKTGGGSEAAAADEEGGAGGIAALGATDKCFSLWHPESPAPLLVGRSFVSRQIIDLAWSPDGRMLVVASADGGVTSVAFGEDELGRRLSEGEMGALLAQLYGDPALRGQNRAGLTAAPDLLQLEARARADAERQERLNSRLGAAPPPLGAGAGVAAAGAAAAVAGAFRAPAARPPAAAAPSAGPTAAGPTSNGPLPQPSQMPPPQPPVAAAPPPPQPQPPARRGMSQPLQAPGGPAAAPSAAGLGGPAPRPAASVAPRAAAASVMAAGASAAAFDAAGAAAAAPAAPPAAAGGYLVPPDAVRASFSVVVHMPSAGAGAAGWDAQSGPLELQAFNTSRDARQRPQAELVCLCGGRRLWSDVMPGHIVAVAGSSRMAAAATSGGDLMVYSSAGRRLFPPIRLGAPASFLSVSPSSPSSSLSSGGGGGGSQVVVLLADGRLRVWDFAVGEALLETNVADLLTPREQVLKVSSVRLSSAGCPVVVLSNAYAYVHHPGMRCWMRVADDAFPASVFTSNVAHTPQGELCRLQANSAQRRQPADMLGARPGAASCSPRSEVSALEHNLAAAAALQSAGEWKTWLGLYVRKIAADEDEPRLRELITDFIGPLRWAAATHPPPPPPGRASASAAFGAGGMEPPPPPPLAASSLGLPGGRWQPVVLGHDKRKLLREVVLRELTRNRNLQHMVSEVMDQLKHLEGPVPAPPAAAAAAAPPARGAAASTGAPPAAQAYEGWPAPGAGPQPPQPPPGAQVEAMHLG